MTTVTFEEQSGKTVVVVHDLQGPGPRKDPICGATPGVAARGGFPFSDEYDVGFLVSGGRTHLIVAAVNATGA